MDIQHPHTPPPTHQAPEARALPQQRKKEPPKLQHTYYVANL